MKAIVKEKPAPGLSVRDVPKPEPGPGEVLIRVRAAGICGTDSYIHEWNSWAAGRIRPPRVIGHEFAGDIAACGAGVTDLEPGRLVSAEGHLACGRCALCRAGDAHICPDVQIIGVDVDGAFAEYVVMPASNVWPVAEGVSVDIAAIHDPLGNAVHVVMAGPVSGRSVVVIGCGPIGCMAVAVARAAGAACVIASEINPVRRGLAKTLGAHSTVDPCEEDLSSVVGEATNGLGADVVCEMSGHPDGIRQAFQVARNGGEVRLLGLPREDVSLDLAGTVIFKGLTVRGILGRRMYETWRQMHELLASKQIDVEPVITHRFPLERVDDAVEAIRSGEAGKVILRIS